MNLDTLLIIGFLWAAKYVNIKIARNAHWIKNIILKLLAKSYTKPIEATRGRTKFKEWRSKS